MPNATGRLASHPFAEIDLLPSPTPQGDRYAGYVLAALVLVYRWLD